MMSETDVSRTEGGELTTAAILSIFRANGLLLAAGDVLAGEQGLTSARWQVLGAINEADRPLTVPQIARRMGLTRQSVHTSVKRLVTDGLVELAPNEDHKRSPLLDLTDRGRETLAAIEAKQATWVNQLAAGLTRSQLQATVQVLSDLCGRLERSRNQTDNPEGGQA